MSATAPAAARTSATEDTRRTTGPPVSVVTSATRQTSPSATTPGATCDPVAETTPPPRSGSAGPAREPGARRGEQQHEGGDGDHGGDDPFAGEPSGHETHAGPRAAARSGLGARIPLAAWTARITAAALCWVSSYSSCGTESATIPAPAWT